MPTLTIEERLTRLERGNTKRHGVGFSAVKVIEHLVSDGSAPNTPSGLANSDVLVTHVGSGIQQTTFIFQWTKNTEPDLSHYEFQFRLDAQNTWDVRMVRETSPQAGDPGISVNGMVPGVDYKARVRAIDLAGNPSAFAEFNGGSAITSTADTGPSGAPSLFGLFAGDGSDGAKTFSINGTLANPKQYTTLTIDSAVEVTPAADGVMLIAVTGLLDNNGIIKATGANGSNGANGSTGSAAGGAGGTGVNGVLDGSAGGDGVPSGGDGDVGVDATTLSTEAITGDTLDAVRLAGASGGGGGGGGDLSDTFKGGAGGAGKANVGAAGAAGTSAAAAIGGDGGDAGTGTNFFTDIYPGFVERFTLAGYGAPGAGGGGGAAHDVSANTPGAGGGGGQGAGIVYIECGSYDGTTGVVQAHGGDGGNGGNAEAAGGPDTGGGGAGSGAGGGLVCIRYKVLVNSGTNTATKGNGGTAGTGAYAGGAGGDGAAGLVVLLAAHV